MQDRALDLNAPLRRPSEHAGARHASGVRKLDSRLLPGQAAAPVEATTPEAGCGATARLELRVRQQQARLLIGCPAQHDLLGPLLGGITGAGARLASTQHHTDPENGRSFLRLALQLPTDPRAIGALERRVSDVARLAQLDFTSRVSDRPQRVAIFVSKYDHCLQDLLQRQRAGELPCEIPLIVSNHPDLRPLATQFGIDYAIIGKNAAGKQDAEARECELLETRDIDLVVMARYMQILSDTFLARWPGRVINIHHSLLPAFVGAKPYHQARRRGVKLIGATAHYATAELDQGPIIEQDVDRCTHQDGVEDLIRKGRDLERLVLGRAVRWHLEDRVFIDENRTIVF
jgi:formyltetrahydrofolate deformylase